MSLSNCINSVGLLLDIVGVLLIWRYGLPEAVNRGGTINLILEQTNEEEAAKAERYDLLSKVGIGLTLLLDSQYSWPAITFEF